MQSDNRFDGFSDLWENGGTLPIGTWFAALDAYQRICGHGSVPPKSHDPMGPLSQWIQRMRRQARSGQLPIAVVWALANRGVSPAIDEVNRGRTGNQEEATFQRNLRNLKRWMRHAAVDGWANLDYRSSRTVLQARQAYTFLEHMRLKLRQSLLRDEHMATLEALALRVNGECVGDWLNATESLRDVSKTMTAKDSELLGIDTWVVLDRQTVRDHLERMRSRVWHLYVPRTGFVRVSHIAERSGHWRLDLADDNETEVNVDRLYGVVGDAAGTLRLLAVGSGVESLLVFARPGAGDQPSSAGARISSLRRDAGKAAYDAYRMSSQH